MTGPADSAEAQVGASAGMVPAAQLRAMITLLWPDQITPVAKRQLESLCEQADERERSGAG